MTNVKLYGPAPSSYVRTARMTLVEKGVDYDLEPEEEPDVAGGTQ